MLLAGTVLWGVVRLAQPPASDEIVVSSQTVQGLRERFEEQQGRAPTDAELDAVVAEWVRGEILVREARARGLDRGDPIVRRRLSQVMRFALEDADRPDDPGDAALERWRSEHADQYRRPPMRSFTQVFVAGHDDAARDRARSIAEALRGGADPQALGDAFPLGRTQPPASSEAIAQRYGDGFAQAVAIASVRTWVVASSAFGWHVIRVDDERPGSLPPLERVRERVLADWRAAERQRGFERGMEELEARYRVEVER